MTLDEAIKHAEEIAEKYERHLKLYENMDDDLFRVEENECKDCAEEHRQLAGWLKELKQLREQEPCEDAVSREDVIKAVDHHTFDTDDGLCLDDDISIILEELPPVKPTRKKGKWINKSQKSGCGITLVASECTCCGMKTPFDCDNFIYRYCPNCGAEMEGEE